MMLEDFEAIGKPFRSMFTGNCRLNWDHKIKRGELVTKLQNANNPTLPVTGVACSRCLRLLDRVEE